MLPEITQANVHIFIPLKVAKIAAYIAAERQMPIADALYAVYASQMYAQLANESTKKWHQGWWSLCEDWQHNQK